MSLSKSTSGSSFLPDKKERRSYQTRLLMTKGSRSSLLLANFKLIKKKQRQWSNSLQETSKLKSRTTWLRWKSNLISNSRWKKRQNPRSVCKWKSRQNRNGSSRNNTRSGTKKLSSSVRSLGMSTNNKLLSCWRCVPGTFMRPRNRSGLSPKFSYNWSTQAIFKCVIRKISIHRRRAWKYLHSLQSDSPLLRVPI